MSEKPLHVQVAEALGCTPYAPINGDPPHDDFWICPCVADDEGNSLHGGPEPLLMDTDKHWDSGYWVKRYDTDWAATGPLMERYAAYAERIHEDGPVAWGVRWRDPEFGEMNEIIANGPTLLVAACHLILALKAAGKL